ncbi:MAG: ankyrin repeat domain-containing protein [Woeseiaceae bacterium]|nr:ankyrin repeat domain-containing protein [Woeseiaceae bacterium]
MSKKANQNLMRAVLEPRKPGALKAIADAIEAGADPNAVCAEGSTSRGRVRGGSTLLTHAIHQWESNAVAKLLECGADPNRADENGWTPWMASTLADESKRRKIQDSLDAYGADKSGEHINALASAIDNGDVDGARELVKSEDDFRVLATFRVDLLGNALGDNNAGMAEFLLENGMKPTSTHLTNAVRFNRPACVELLLRFGLPPERPGESETVLMVAAREGFLEIAKRLVEAGANVNRSADEDGEWTPSFYARQGGHNEIADWLESRMGESALQHQDELAAARDPKFARLYEQATSGEGLATDDLVEVLSGWDAQYGLKVREASGDSVALEFDALPGDLDGFLREVVDLCPDAIDGERELRAELEKSKSLYLWWD